MSFERSYSIEFHERIKLILIFGDKSLLLTWWVTYASNQELAGKAGKQLNTMPFGQLMKTWAA